MPVVSLLPTLERQAAVREQVREMFVFAYDSYMAHAYPEVSFKYAAIQCSLLHSIMPCCRRS